MPSPASTFVASLCQADSSAMADRIRRTTGGSLTGAALLIVLGCGAYGFTIGLWRAPLQGAYVAVKMPLLIFATVLLNGGINGMLAQVLFSGLSFRQTFQAILQSFALFSLIVGSLSPLALFLTIESPAVDSGAAYQAYPALMLTHTLVIAYAGVIANVRLLRTIGILCGDPAVARRVLVAWLAGNLFVGAQISYLFRPFFGQPKLPVQFLRPNPFEGNFYDSVWRSFQLSVSPTMALAAVAGLALGILLFTAKRTTTPNSKPNNTP